MKRINLADLVALAGVLAILLGLWWIGPAVAVLAGGIVMLGLAALVELRRKQ
jgi:hypothetical protein